jgi:hypothetical protein
MDEGILSHPLKKIRGSLTETGLNASSFSGLPTRLPVGYMPLGLSFSVFQ